MTSIQASAPPQLKPSRTGGRTLGSLESRLMNTLWDSSSELTVQEVCDRLGGRNYKTIMTVLNRLVDKGMLVRQLHGRAFRYLPRMNRNAFLRGAADDIVENYVQSFGPQAIPHMTAALAAVASQPGHQPAAAEHHDNVIPFRPAALAAPLPAVAEAAAPVTLPAQAQASPIAKPAAAETKHAPTATQPSASGTASAAGNARQGGLFGAFKGMFGGGKK